MADVKISHFLFEEVKLGDQVTAACGASFTVADEASNRPLCHACTLVLVDTCRSQEKEIQDLRGRIYDIARSLEITDEFGQGSWINTAAKAVMENALWRVGDALPEGPRKEDGTF